MKKEQTKKPVEKKATEAKSFDNLVNEIKTLCLVGTTQAPKGMINIRSNSNVSFRDVIKSDYNKALIWLDGDLIVRSRRKDLVSLMDRANMKFNKDSAIIIFKGTLKEPLEDDVNRFEVFKTKHNITKIYNKGVLKHLDTVWCLNTIQDQNLFLALIKSQYGFEVVKK